MIAAIAVVLTCAGLYYLGTIDRDMREDENRG